MTVLSKYTKWERFTKFIETKLGVHPVLLFLFLTILLICLLLLVFIWNVESVTVYRTIGSLAILSLVSCVASLVLSVGD